MGKFQLMEYSREGMSLLSETKQAFIHYGYDTSDLPQSLYGDERPLKLVFIGQYSAGKSSIIKMLTGEDVAIGAKITTELATSYPWNGIEIVDTPGIHTELRPDHDELTYDEINHAALLVFVITNEGFSQRMGEHFRKLAIDQKRGGNMVLVINKMDRAALGNVLEQQKIIEMDINKVIEPYTPAELYLSFLDTTSYFDSLEESDDVMRQELLVTSGYDIFIDNLNRFVSSHKFMAQLSKPLYTLAEKLRLAMRAGEQEQNADIEAFVQTLEHRRDMVGNGKEIMLRDVRSLAEKYRDEIVSVGRNTASVGCGCTEEAEFNDAMTAGQREIEDLIAKSKDEVEDSIKSAVAIMNEKIRKYDSSEYVQKINTNIQIKLNEESSMVNKTAVMGVLTALGGVVAKFNNPEAVAGAVPLYANIVGKGAGMGIDALMAEALGPFSKIVSGGASQYITKLLTPSPKLIEQAGALFARNAAKIGMALGAAAAVYGIYANWKEADLQEQADKNRRAIKADLMERFNQMADDYYQKTMLAAGRYVEENIAPIEKSLEDELLKIRAGQEQNITAQQKFREHLHKTDDLLLKIQTV